MYYWIYNGEIAGDSDSDAIQPPPGWSIAEGPDGGRDSLYYDGTAVLLKPERPTETALWDASTNSWLEPPAPPEPVPSPNWAALGDALVADIPILNKLAANPLFPALVGRLQTLRQGAVMGEPEPLIALWNNHSYSFTAAERKRFNDLATANLIPLRVSTDGSLGPLA